MLHKYLYHHIDIHDNFEYFDDILSSIMFKIILLNIYHSKENIVNYMKIKVIIDDRLLLEVKYIKNIQDYSLYMLHEHMLNNQMDNLNMNENKNQNPFL